MPHLTGHVQTWQKGPHMLKHILTWTATKYRNMSGNKLNDTIRSTNVDTKSLIARETLQWHHNGRDSVSNHQLHDCLLNRLVRRRSKKTSKLRVTGLWVGNSPGTSEFPAQMASYAGNVSIWWRHHELGNKRVHMFSQHYIYVFSAAGQMVTTTMY